MTSISSLITSAIALAFCTALTASPAEWPEKLVRIIVLYSAGGNTDHIARQTAQMLAETFGKTFVADNRPGANDLIAAELTAKAAADGYTPMIAAAPQLCISPALGKVPYDPVKDFAPVSIVSTNSFVLVVNRLIPASIVKDLIELART